MLQGGMEIIDHLQRLSHYNTVKGVRLDLIRARQIGYNRRFGISFLDTQNVAFYDLVSPVFQCVIPVPELERAPLYVGRMSAQELFNIITVDGLSPVEADGPAFGL
jgi:hypothetical protein